MRWVDGGRCLGGDVCVGSKFNCGRGRKEGGQDHNGISRSVAFALLAPEQLWSPGRPALAALEAKVRGEQTTGSSNYLGSKAFLIAFALGWA